MDVASNCILTGHRLYDSIRAIGIFPPDGAYSRGCREQGVDLMIVDGPGKGADIGSADRLSFVQDGCRTREQRTIDGVAVSYDPADIRRDPKDINPTGHRQWPALTNERDH